MSYWAMKLYRKRLIAYYKVKEARLRSLYAVCGILEKWNYGGNWTDQRVPGEQAEAWLGGARRLFLGKWKYSV